MVETVAALATGTDAADASSPAANRGHRTPDRALKRGDMGTGLLLLVGLDAADGQRHTRVIDARPPRREIRDGGAESICSRSAREVANYLAGVSLSAIALPLPAVSGETIPFSARQMTRSLIVNVPEIVPPESGAKTRGRLQVDLRRVLRLAVRAPASWRPKRVTDGMLMRTFVLAVRPVSGFRTPVAGTSGGDGHGRLDGRKFSATRSPWVLASVMSARTRRSRCRGQLRVTGQRQGTLGEVLQRGRPASV